MYMNVKKAEEEGKANKAPEAPETVFSIGDVDVMLTGKASMKLSMSSLSLSLAMTYYIVTSAKPGKLPSQVPDMYAT